MRVVAGTAARTKLVGGSSRSIRPTTDAMRETLFNILGAQVLDTRFLDLCAGVGAVGIEALSRGARFATFVDQNGRAVRTIAQNLQRTGFEEQGEVFCSDVRRVLPRLDRERDPYHLVFLDPPYVFPSLVAVVERLIVDRLCLAEDALIIVQHHRKSELPTIHPPRRQRQFGDSVLSFYR